MLNYNNNFLKVQGHVMHEQPIYPIMATFPICAEQGDIGSGFGVELEKPQYYWKRLLSQGQCWES